MLDEADASKQSLNFGPVPVTADAALVTSSFKLGCAPMLNQSSIGGSSGKLQAPEENLLPITNSEALGLIAQQNSQVLFEDQGQPDFKEEKHISEDEDTVFGLSNMKEEHEK